MVAPVAQLDRASASGVEGHEFESRRVYHFFLSFSGNLSSKLKFPLFFAIPSDSIKFLPSQTKNAELDPVGKNRGNFKSHSKNGKDVIRKEL